MSDINGGPAFPGSYTGNNGMPVWSDGMTLRDYFAANAVRGYISSTTVRYTHNGCSQVDVLALSKLATLSYEMADAMIAAREQGEA